MLPDFSYVCPTSIKQVLAEISSPGALLHAGGTDLLGCLRDGALSGQKVVSLRALQELRGIRATRDGGLRIGALTTLAEVAAHPLIAERYTALSQGAASAASPQLRNQGTLGGNLCQRPRCWYFRGDFHCLRKGGEMCYAVAGENEYHCIFGGNGCYIVHPSDTAPALLALGAQVRAIGPGGTRTIPIESFFVLPAADLTRENVLARDEVLVEILLPAADLKTRSSYRKVRARGAWDFALAGVALALQMTAGRVDGARVVLSGVAPAPWRSKQAEQALLGRALDADTAAAVAAASVAGAEPMSQNAYKVELVRGIVQEALLAFG